MTLDRHGGFLILVKRTNINLSCHRSKGWFHRSGQLSGAMPPIGILVIFHVLNRRHPCVRKAISGCFCSFELRVNVVHNSISGVTSWRRKSDHLSLLCRYSNISLQFITGNSPLSSCTSSGNWNIRKIQECHVFQWPTLVIAQLRLFVVLRDIFQNLILCSVKPLSSCRYLTPTSVWHDPR